MIPVLPLPEPRPPLAVASIDAAKMDWAALYTRLHGHATPELIQRWLHVGPDQARAVISELVRRNVLAPPIAGSAAAVQPMYPSRGARMMADHAKTAVEDYLSASIEHEKRAVHASDGKTPPDKNPDAVN